MKTEKLQAAMAARTIRNEDRCDLQDEIGRATLGELAEFENGLDSTQRRMFLWVIFSVSDAEMAVNILKETVVRRSWLEEVERHEKAMAEDWEVQDARIKAEYQTWLGERDETTLKAETLGRELQHQTEVRYDVQCQLNDARNALADVKNHLHETQAELAELRGVTEALSVLRGFFSK